MTSEDFDTALYRVLADRSASTLLGVPGVYEAVAEYFNNEVLDQWAEGNPEKAYPAEESDDATP